MAEFQLTVRELHRHGGNTLFLQLGKDPPHLIQTHLGLTQEDWEALGCPEKLIVTIESGDQLPSRVQP